MKWFNRNKPITPKKRAFELFRSIYFGQKPFQCSLVARKNLGRDQDPTLLYGEICFSSFWDFLHTLPITDPMPFIDCGSGSGKAVFTACLTNLFSKVQGVECLEPLYAMSEVVLEKLQADSSNSHQTCNVEFHWLNWKDFCFEESCVVFVTATGYFGDDWTALVAKLETLPQGSLLLLGTKKINSTVLEEMSEVMVEMSWGYGRITVYQKK